MEGRKKKRFGARSSQPQTLVDAEARDLPANSTWTCLDRSSLSLPTGEGDGVHGIVWLGPNLSAYGSRRSKTSRGMYHVVPFSLGARRTWQYLSRTGPIARTRAICPGNIPHGMPSVCPAFVSASFRFLRQHGGLSVIYPRLPNTRYSETFIELDIPFLFVPSRRLLRQRDAIRDNMLPEVTLAAALLSYYATC